MGTLGTPSKSQIYGLTRKIEYEGFNVWLYLEKRKVYMLGVLPHIPD
jgi:hypothetical protein